MVNDIVYSCVEGGSHTHEMVSKLREATDPIELSE
jgi:hypothetical protein